MLKLPGVTIFTMVWAEDQKWIQRAGAVLRYCEKIIECDKRILFVHQKIPPGNYPWDTVYIPQLNWQSYNIFVNRVVPRYIQSDYVMSVHEDGFPISLELWKDDFLNYDYIGAPWSDNVVGNGGFSIESRRLLELKCSMPVEADEFSTASDRLICTSRRAWLEERGIRFAPADLAVRFSTEQTGHGLSSFGFHGRQVQSEKYRTGWTIIRNMNLRVSQGFTLDRNKAVHVSRRNVPPNVRAMVGIEPAIPASNIAVIYVYPVAGGKFDDNAKRFAASYSSNMPLISHDLYIISNGSPSTATMLSMFNGIRCKWKIHDNSGYDIGAYQMAAREIPCEMMVFFGSSTTFRKANWLERMWEAFKKHGNALYGTMGNQGDPAVNVKPHIRTTGFWMSPKLMNEYPHRIIQAAHRYEFEHGKSCLTGWVTARGLKALVVTWDGEYEWPNWDSIPNGFHRGNQSALLCRDHISEPPYYPDT